MTIQTSPRILWSATSLLALAVASLPAVPALGQSAGPSETLGEDIVVRGYVLSQIKAIAEKRETTAITDSISTDELNNLPSKNISEALLRLPGISISQDQGEGRFVSIRGASPTLNAVTINGQPLGTIDEGGERRIPLDVLGGELVGGVTVVKAGTPDMEANAIGGYIDVKTQSPLDFEDKVFGNASASISEDEFKDYRPYALNGTIGAKFGPDDSFGVLVGAAYADRRYFTKGLYVDDWRPVAGIDRGLPESHKFNNYELDRDRLAFTGVAEYKPDEDTLYYFRALWTQNDELELRYRNRNYFSREDEAPELVINGDGATGSFTDQRARAELREESKERRFGTFAIGGENRISAFAIDYSASYTIGKTSEPSRNWVFQGNNITSGTFDMTDYLFEINTDNEQALASLDEYGLNGYSDTLTEVRDEGYQIAANIQYDLALDGMEGFIKFGGLYRAMEKTRNVDSSDFDGDFDLSTPGLVVPNGFDYRLKGRDYFVGPQIDRDGLVAFTDANLTNAAIFDGGLEVGDSALGDYVTQEDILAGYLMGSLTMGEFTVVAGARLENTDISSVSSSLVNGSTIEPTTAGGSYTDILPSVHLQYRSQSLPLVVRGAWTNTIGRPAYGDITAGRSVERIAGDGESAAFEEINVSVGNPDLTSFESMNFDLSVEYYIGTTGLISLAGFYKDIDGFIATRTAVTLDTSFEGQTVERLSVSQPINAEKGEIKGVEFGYQQLFSFLPAPFDGLGVNGSLTLVDSSTKFPGRDDELPFIRQADTTYSLSVFYNKGPLEVYGTYSWTDDILVELGGDVDGDIYDKAYGRLDMRGSYQITSNFQLFVEAINLNNAPLGEFIGPKSNNWVTRSEVYGRRFTIGLSAKL